MRWLTIFALALLLLAGAQISSAQTVGLERNVIYTPPTADIATNINALSFGVTSGMNTFLLDVQPTVSARVHITNTSANACLGVFSVTMYATADKTVQSFNNSPASWQIIPLISSSGGFTSSTSVDLPASSTVYVTSSAISANRIAVQLVNNTGACSSTTITLKIVFSAVAVTSPLLSVTGNGTSFSGANVQGVVPSAQNGQSVFPIVNGALRPAINAGFNTVGADNFSGTTFSQANGVTGTISQGAPPQPTALGETAFAWLAWGGAIGGTGVIAPWTCQDNGTGATSGGACGSSSVTSAGIGILKLTNASPSQQLLYNVANTNSGTTDTIFLEFPGLPTTRQHTGALAANPGLASTLAGSTVVVAFSCTGGPPCSVASVSDTQGNKYSLVKNLGGGAGVSGRLSVWITGPTSAAAITVTPTAASGSNTINISSGMELTSVTAANLNLPNTALLTSNPAGTANENDQGGLFIESAGFSMTQTVTLAGAATTTFPLWQQPQHGVFQSCTLDARVTAASGTTPTLNTYLQDSGDNVGFNDRVSLPQATTTGHWIGIVPTFTAGNLAALAQGAVATTDAALAAGSVIAGRLGPYGRVKFVEAGTTPSFTITYSVVCQ